MRKVIISFVIILLVISSCETTDDILNSIDHEVPTIDFGQDSLTVDAGASVIITATIEDESGIERIEFSYGNWRINEIVDLSDQASTEIYEFTSEVTVPVDAVKEWEEDKYFNDGSSIKIIQKYHRLELKAWDKYRNQKKSIVYIKVN
jgi:hypothetical protein